jgi:UMF1 family MFS transporter
MAAVAVLGPFLGIVADRTASKKKFLAAFAALGIAASALMFFIPPGGWRAAAALYALGTVGVAGSLVFYDALLPGVAREEDLDRVSALGYALGYGGSVVLFFVNVLLYLKPDLLGIADRGTAVRLAFVSVAVWWGLFTIPVLRGVPEPPAAAAGRPGLVRAVRDLARFRSLLLFLAAFWIYADGIGTIIKLAAGFGYMLKLDQKDLLLALVIPQVLGVPCSLAFGRLAGRVGAKRAILLGLAGYAAVCLLAWGIRKPWHFYALAAGVGLVQGGTQALSRSLFALLVPQGRTAEFFGLFSTVEKFAGIVGPFLLGAIWSRGGDPRPGILALVVFFAAGAAVLAGVDVEKGRRQAEEAL